MSRHRVKTLPETDLSTTEIGWPAYPEDQSRNPGDATPAWDLWLDKVDSGLGYIRPMLGAELATEGPLFRSPRRDRKLFLWTPGALSRRRKLMRERKARYAEAREAKGRT